MVLALAALAGAGAELRAQIPGMPLFTNPRYGTGVRLHADVGQATEAGTSLGDLTVVQGGVTLAVGPVGLGANVGAKRNDLESASEGCANCDPETAVTASALAQIRIAGGGRSNLSLSLFGGASLDVKAYDFADLTDAQRDTLEALGIIGDGSRLLTIPVGAAVGLRIPLGLASLNLWGAPRVNISKLVNCPTGSTACDESESKFRWAVGADLPIFRVISVRAAYDSGKIGDQTVSFWGVGASIGIGGMR
jgi:hypothetical protein